MADKLKVHVQIMPIGKQFEVAIPLSWPVRLFISEFTEKAKLTGSYDAQIARTNTFLDYSKTIGEVGLQEGDTIYLRRYVVGGGPSEDLEIYSYNKILKESLKSNLSKSSNIPDNILEQLVALAEKENILPQKRLAIYYLFTIYSILIISTIIIIFLQGFHVYGFDIDKEMLKWLGVSVLGEVAGLAALVYGSLFKVGENTLDSNEQ